MASPLVFRSPPYQAGPGMTLSDFLATPLPKVRRTPSNANRVMQEFHTDIFPERMFYWASFQDEVYRFQLSFVDSHVGNKWYGACMDKELDVIASDTGGFPPCVKGQLPDVKLSVVNVLGGLVRRNTPSLNIPFFKHQATVGRPELGFLHTKGRGLDLLRDEYLVVGIVEWEGLLPRVSASAFMDATSAVNAAPQYGNMRRAVSRLFSYMKLNSLKFGLITTWEETWFFFRDGCALGMSDPVHRTAKPLLSLWCLFHLSLTAATAVQIGGGDRDVSAYFKRQLQPREEKLSTMRFRLQSASSRWSVPLQREVLEGLQVWDDVDYIVGLFKKKTNKHDFQCAEDVFNVQYKGRDAVIKVRDLSGREGKSQEGGPKLERWATELQAYALLGPLQGKVVPELLAHGVMNGTMLAFTVLTRAGSRMMTNGGADMQLALYSIHALGVGHGDFNLCTDVLHKAREREELGAGHYDDSIKGEASGSHGLGHGQQHDERGPDFVFVGLSRSFFFEPGRPSARDIQRMLDEMGSISPSPYD